MKYSLEQKLKPGLTQKQSQRLMMTPHMQQAIFLLQLPVMELSGLIEEEIENNPVLEYFQEESEGSAQEENENPDREVKIDDRDFEILMRLDQEYTDFFSESRNPHLQRPSDENDKQSFLENTARWQTTLFEHLMQQAEKSFGKGKELELAEQIIGSLDGNGYLTTPLEEIATLHQYPLGHLEDILEEIQRFDPAGVGARDLRESLLIQLRALGKQKTLAYRIIEIHFSDLLANRMPLIVNQLGCTLEEAKEAVNKHIALLDIHPGTKYSKEVVQNIVPDAYIHLEDDSLKVEVNEEELRPVRLNRKYMDMLKKNEISDETREYIKNKIMSAKWLMRTLYQRNDTLYRIVQALAEKQREFFIRSRGVLVPLVMKTIAEELDLHESTIARTVSNKYLESPRGLLPLKFFFTNAYETASGEMLSSKTVQNELSRLIDTEDKKKPLSDEVISKLLKRKGIQCARRTVTKLRSLLQIGNTRQRKKWE